MASAPTTQRSPGGDWLPDDEVARLVDIVNGDERLRREAAAVGLSGQDILELAHGLTRRLANVPLDLSGALAQAKREAAAVEAVRQRRNVWLKVLAVVSLLSVWGSAVIAVLFWLRYQDWVLFLLVAIVALPALAWVSWWVFDNWWDNFYAYGYGALRASAAVEEAEDAIERFRVNEIAKRIRTEINERDDEQYRTTMSGVESRGLAEIENPRHVVDTPGGDRLKRLLRDMPGGSIGLSGPRGVGKSSLIRATCPSEDKQPEGLLGVIVAAPVQFNAREFVLHLFAEVCRTILGPDEVDRLRTPDPVYAAELRLRGPRMVLLAAAPLILLAGIGMLVVELANIDPNLLWANVVIVVGGLACLAALYTNRLRHLGRVTFPYQSWSWEREQRFGDKTINLARQRLTDIWFQQSFTSGWSGSINLPIGVEGGLEGGRELARQQLSMPDIVSELRRLVGALTSKRDESTPFSPISSTSGAQVQVRIGIDELDKIDSLDDACKFMNEIKVLFGIPGCFFLVSLSEDAMSRFERRGLPMRDVFDSSFDDVVRVEPLAASGSVALLRERTIGMPVPFMLLCHAMGGGLPRDVIRMAREILPGDDGPHRLSIVCRELVASQVTAKIDATLVAARRCRHIPELDGFQRWLEGFRKRPTDPASLIEIGRDPDPVLRAVLGSWPAVDGSNSAVVDLPRGLLTYCYFSATIQEFFVDERSPAVYRTATWGDDAPAMADELARAHQAFTVHLQAAWEATTRIREQLGAAPLSFPEPQPARMVSNDTSRLGAATRAFIQHLTAGPPPG